jgi:dUTP pyrophosphatase
MEAMIAVPVQKLHESAKIPVYAYDHDAGFDLFACEEVTIAPGKRAAVKTGIALAIPDGYAGLIWDKSGISINGGLKTLGGVVDAGYRGEVLVGIVNLSGEPYTFKAGDKVAQMLVQKVERVTLEEVGILDDTSRSDRGFGSSGK